MHDILFRNQQALGSEDLLRYVARVGADPHRVARELAAGSWTKKVRDDFRGGVKSGVNGTPTFFINGIRYDGNWADAAEFVQALTEAATQDHVGAS
jgi:protein-disulfide isomerase